MKGLILFLTVSLFSLDITSQWYILNSGTTNVLRDICFLDANIGITGGNSGLILRTIDGGLNWSVVNAGISQDIYSLCFPVQTCGYASGYTGFVRYSLTMGATWLNAQSCGINVRSISFINSYTGITGGGGTLMCYTINGGMGWAPRNTPSPHQVTGVHFVNSNLLMVCASDMPGAVIHKSTNTGYNWSTVMTLNNSGLNTTYSLSSIYFKDNITGFATGSSSNFGQVYGRLYRSTNMGDNWSLVGGSGPALMSSIWGVHFGDPQTGYAVGSLGVILKSTNGGANWEEQASGTTESLLSVYMINSTTGYICGSNGIIMKTTNGGLTGFIPVNNKIPNEYSLCQNYPNPFNPTTKIKFDIPSSSPLNSGKDQGVRLDIYNPLGQHIETLVNESAGSGLNAGTYEIDFDGSNLVSGIYYYTLIVNEKVYTRKMVLLK